MFAFIFLFFFCFVFVYKKEANWDRKGMTRGRETKRRVKKEK
jgi:hypothetical protein